MSLKAVTWALDLELPPNEKLVLIAIVDHISPEGYCWPSQERIARRASVSVRTVRTLIQKLEDRGILIRERYRANPSGARTTDAYRVNPEWPNRQILPPDSTGNSEGGNRQTVAGSENPQRTPNNNNSAKRPAIPLPEDWTPTEEHKAMAMARGLDVEEQALAFRFHAEANGRTQVVWNAAFSQWIMNARPNRTYVPTTRSGSPVPAAPKYPDAPPIDDDWQPYFPPPLEN